MVRTVRNAHAPIFFFQAENDYDLSPSRTLSAAMNDAGKLCEMKIYPPYGNSASDGHSFAYLGSSVWRRIRLSGTTLQVSLMRVLAQSAAIKRRARCGSVRSRPVVSAHFFPGAAPQVGQRTASTSFRLSPFFMAERYYPRPIYSNGQT